MALAIFRAARIPYRSEKAPVTIGPRALPRILLKNGTCRIFVIGETMQRKR